MSQGIFRVNIGFFKVLVLYKPVQCTSIGCYGLYFFFTFSTKNKSVKEEKIGRNVFNLSVIWKFLSACH